MAWESGGRTCWMDSMDLLVRTVVSFSMVDRSRPSSWSSPWMASRGTCSCSCFDIVVVVVDDCYHHAIKIGIN